MGAEIFDVEINLDGVLIYSDSKKTKLVHCLESAYSKITIPQSVITICDDAF